MRAGSQSPNSTCTVWVMVFNGSVTNDLSFLDQRPEALRVVTGFVAKFLLCQRQCFATEGGDAVFDALHATDFIDATVQPCHDVRRCARRCIKTEHAVGIETLEPGFV